MRKEILKKSRVVFNDVTHTYRLDGIELYGVTGIVKWMFPETYKDIPQSVLEKAAEYGTLIHKKCEQYDSCGFGDDMDEVKAYVRMKEEHGLKTLCNEYLVDDGSQIASSIDVVFDVDGNGCYPLADIKTTSQIHKNNVRLQLSIYAYLFELCNKGKKAGCLYVIWLPKAMYGKPRLIELERIPSDGCKEIIDACFDLCTSDEKRKELRLKYFGEEPKELACNDERLPAELLQTEAEIVNLETTLKELEAKKSELKRGLYDLMLSNGVKKWTGEKIEITRKTESIRESVDTAKIKNKYPEIYEECKKLSKVSGSILIKIL